MRNLFERGRIILDILGLLATLFVLYQATTFLFFDKRAISAAYKTAVLAQSGPVFDITGILDPAVSQSKKILETDVIVWNSGTQEIDEKDVRREVNISIDQASSILVVKPGIQHSNKIDDFHFEHVAGTSAYKLNWAVFDPGDFFEIHFLIGTNLETSALPKIVQVDGLFAGNVGVSLRALQEIRENRIGMGGVIGVTTFFLLFALIVVMLSSNKQINQKLSAMGQWPGVPIFLGTMLLMAGLAYVIAVPIAGYFFYVPTWLEPQFTLPFLHR